MGCMYQAGIADPRSFTAEEGQFLEKGCWGLDPTGFFGRNSVGNAGNTILMVLCVMGNLKLGRLSHSLPVSWEAAAASQENPPQAFPS